jgi:predicted phage-related endonuclease
MFDMSLNSGALKDLADKYGQMKAVEAEAQRTLAILKEMILETELPEIEGVLFKVVVSEFDKTTIDTKALKKAHPVIAKKFEKTATITMVSCKAR